MIPSPILYPIARDQAGAAVHIDDWQRGQAVTCFGCDEDLIGRLPFDGIKPTAHFAHKADVACNGETALHKSARAAIVRARENGGLQSLSWECPRCKRCLQLTDLRSVVLREEKSPCKGVVSDVLGADASGRPCVAIEVVVTHDMESETLERYQSLPGLYVFTLRPSWGIVGDIVRGVDPLTVEYRAGLVDTSSCEGCQQVLREKEEWAARERAQKVKAWWDAWASAWGYIAKEVLWLFEEQRRELLAQRTREQTWWKSWAHVWQRVAEQIVDTWWVEWRQLWREVGIQHARPYAWQRTWQAAWEAIGKQYAADEAERTRRRVEVEVRMKVRGRNWWPAWILMWTEIGRRESGAMSAWRPICKRCRQDLTRDHICPRRETST